MQVCFSIITPGSDPLILAAGFNYKFDSLTTPADKNELSNAFAALFSSSAGLRMTIVPALRAMVPTLRPLLKHVVRIFGHSIMRLCLLIPLKRVKGDVEMKAASETMARVGNQLLTDSKAALRTENDKFEKSSWKSRDLLSLLLRANMATDIPTSQRMEDEDVIARKYFEARYYA